ASRSRATSSFPAAASLVRSVAYFESTGNSFSLLLAGRSAPAEARWLNVGLANIEVSNASVVMIVVTGAYLRFIVLILVNCRRCDHRPESQLAAVHQLCRGTDVTCQTSSRY